MFLNVLARAFAVMVLLAAPIDAGHAQRVTPSAFVRGAAAPDGVLEAAEANRPRARKYVLTGALLGTTAMVVGLVVYLQATNGEVFTPFAFVPAVLGAAVVGGAAGYVVYHIRY